jgi:hypothetical protein
MARTVVKRRDLQIRLGLAKPRRPKAQARPAAPPAPQGAAPRSLSEEEQGPSSRAA